MRPLSPSAERFWKREQEILGNPKAKIQILEAETKRELVIREKLTEIEKNLERLESDRRIFTEQLESYKDLDANWREHSEERRHEARTPPRLQSRRDQRRPGSRSLYEYAAEVGFKARASSGRRASRRGLCADRPGRLRAHVRDRMDRHAVRIGGSESPSAPPLGAAGVVHPSR